MASDTPDKYEKIPRQRFQDLDRKGKLQYILDYYSLHILIGVTVLVLVVAAIIYYGFQYRRVAFYAMGVNVSASQEDEARLAEDFAASAGLNTRRERAEFDLSNYASGDDSADYNLFLKLTTLIGARELDVLFFSDAMRDSYERLGAFSDLQELLPAALYDRCASDGLLITGTWIEDGETPPYTYAMAIDVTDTAFVQNYRLTPTAGSRIYLGVSVAPGHQEAALELLRFVLEQ